MKPFITIMILMQLVSLSYNCLLRAESPRIQYLDISSINSLYISNPNTILVISDLLEEHDVLLIFSPIIENTINMNIVAKLYKKGNINEIANVCFSKDQLIKCLDSEKCCYYSPDLYKLFLQSFESELEGIQNLYYCPCEDLSMIALEYCVDMEGRMLCEKYNVFRLSSPDILSSRGSRKNYSKVSIWGGIDFYAKLAGCTFFEYSDTSTISKCNLGYLEDSYRVAKTINEEMQLQGVNSTFYCDETATEERIKSEHWDDVDVFFIETHGLILNHYKMENTQGEEAPMDYHALALAGASYVLEGGIVPNGVENGILTANEISELNMNNVDLAVISACKSALVEIKGDGVYGLMRGFKEAGVRSLIMATDDIVDYVSGQLWIQLFRNLAKGMNKREALLEGLKYIRTMDGGAFSHPKFWTPFILIDGIE